MGACFSDVNDTQHAVGAAYKPTGMGGPGGDSAREAASSATALLNGSSAYCSWVEVRLECKHLAKQDALSKSDPMGVLYEVQPDGTQRELGRTEAVAANHHPVFTTPFKVLYNFERVQTLRLMVVDLDSGHKPESVNPAKCDFLGELQLTLSELVTAKEKRLIRPLNTKSSKTSQAILTCVKLRNLDVMSKSDPYLEVYKAAQGDGAAVSWVPVYRTEVRNNNLNPVWQPLVMRAVQLYNGDVHRPLLLKVYDWDPTGQPELIGQVEANASKLEAAAASGALLTLTVPGKPGKDCGAIKVQTYKIERKPTFLDYIQAGTEISFIVGVDWTASNRPPTDPYSLHYLNPNGALTPYEQALLGVGRVLEFYDSDRNYPAFGFGGQVGQGPVSHCFPLNGQPEGVCLGIQGILQAYRMALTAYALSGPTLFAPLVQRAAAVAAQPTPHLRYSVLLILTDGMILDMPDTVDAIVAASSLPLSILIVGVGSADFTDMTKLDSDKGRLRAQSGRYAERDIVQFVEFRKFASNADSLAAELLAELPGQFLEFVRAHNIPLPALPPPPTAIPTPQA